MKEKAKGLMDKVGKVFKSGTKAAKSGIRKVQSTIEDRKASRALEKDLKELFDSNAVLVNLVSSNEKTEISKVNIRIDYDKKLITIYGERKDITNKSFFIDELNQKFKVHLVRLNQYVELTIDDVEYKRPATIIQFTLEKDEETKKQMRTIIDKSITIRNSTINKSDIG